MQDTVCKLQIMIKYLKVYALFWIAFPVAGPFVCHILWLKHGDILGAVILRTRVHNTCFICLYMNNIEMSPTW